MLCDNCGKRNANVRYSENINGRRKELNLCEICSEKLGITQMDFNMPIDFSSFLGGFLEDWQTPEFMPMFKEIKNIKCNNCGNTFEDITKSGRLGCQNCYEVFEEKLDPMIKRIQGSNKHIGRIGKKLDNIKTEEKEEIKKESTSNITIDNLKEKLKKAIKEERYEDAAKLRDEIKKLEL